MSDNKNKQIFFKCPFCFKKSKKQVFGSFKTGGKCRTGYLLIIVQISFH